MRAEVLIIERTGLFVFLGALGKLHGNVLCKIVDIPESVQLPRFELFDRIFRKFRERIQMEWNFLVGNFRKV